MGNLDVDMAAVALAQALPPGFIAVPATTLPGGVEVPAFAVARWLAAATPPGGLHGIARSARAALVRAVERRAHH
ncbi:hypothetical protein [Massilia sp. CT11-137]|uniref:hypothetical protein n=1 Tax=Massilia sp. CT11-137 TaxID=3393901 RepID=UPI0039A4BFF3